MNISNCRCHLAGEAISPAVVARFFTAAEILFRMAPWRIVAESQTEEPNRKYGNVASVKTTLDLPDDVLRNAKATAAVRGESLRDFVASALQARLRYDSSARRSGWRGVFGLARAAEVAAVDRIISRDLETVELAEWQ
jgi:hypothetical protein